mgnify:CR=1 FL=1
MDLLLLLSLRGYCGKRNSKNIINIMKKYPCVLSIAGSDCSGGAGIQADIKTISAAGVYAASAVTAVTVQNTCGVSDVFPVPPQYVAAQIEAVMSDIHPDAVKIGMVSDADTVRAIAECLSRFKPRYIVFDPVMVSSSGRKLMSDEAVTVICQELFPLCTLITPNIDEASMLLHRKITTVDEMKAAAREHVPRRAAALCAVVHRADGADLHPLQALQQPLPQKQHQQYSNLPLWNH